MKKEFVAAGFVLLSFMSPLKATAALGILALGGLGVAVLTQAQAKTVRSHSNRSGSWRTIRS